MSDTALLWTGQEIAMAIRGEGPTAWATHGVSIDSRTIQRGELFLALHGPAFDGHDYVAQALDAGAVAAIVHKQPAFVAADAPLLMVADSFAALQDLGSTGRARTQAKIIAVTGSVGKTGSKEQLRLMLGACAKTYATEGSFNNHWGVPLSLARLPRDTQYGVFELGMNHAGEMATLSQQVRPHVALITTIEAVHLEFFADAQAIADAKAEIFLGMSADGTAVLPRDNPHFSRLVAAARTKGIGHVLGFGRDEGADARLLSCDLLADRSHVTAAIMGKTITYTIAAAGIHLVMNSLGTLLAATAAGADLATCAEALSSFSAPSGRGARSQIAIPGGNITIIDESYNASPVATRAAIAVLGQSTPEQHGRRIAVLGDMRELGPTAPQLHAALAESLIAANADAVYCCGHIMQALHEALPAARRGTYTENSKDLAALLPSQIRPGDVILVKGSKSVHMDYVVNALRALNTDRTAPLARIV